MKSKITFALLVLFSLLGCTKEPSGQQCEYRIRAKNISNIHHLELNKGARWEVDKHTRDSLSKMTALINRDDTKGVGGLLQKELNLLIQGCTMKGAAHDELHKFLSAYIPSVQRLATEETRKNTLVVKELLILYPKFFK